MFLRNLQYFLKKVGKHDVIPQMKFFTWHSYRFGNFEATSEKKVVQIDQGNLMLTNKRVVFSGLSK